MSQNPANIRWGDVSERIKGELETARLMLETAPIADVPVLQGQVAALKTVIEWFERGAINERAMLFTPNPHAGDD